MSPERQLDVNAVVIGKGAAVPAKTILRGAANTVLTQTVVNEEPAFTKVDLGTMVTGDIDLATQVTGTLPIGNGGTGTTLGNLVIWQFWGTAVVVAGATVTLGREWNTFPVEVTFTSPVTGIAIRMNVNSTVGPGGTDTFKYRLRVGLGASAVSEITVTGAALSGASDFTLSLSRGDVVNIRLVGSATAVTTNHMVMVVVQVTG